MSNRVAINISPLCGYDSVHILQRTNGRTFEAKPSPLIAEAAPTGRTSLLEFCDHFADAPAAAFPFKIVQPRGQHLDEALLRLIGNN